MTDSLLQLSRDIPLDPVLREMKRGRPYVLGLGRATELPESADDPWTERVAHALRTRSGRSTLFIETELSDSPSFAGNSETIRSGVTHAFWPVASDTNRPSFRELAAFPRWKQEYALIVLHMGAIESLPFSSLGKLCDGIAIAADMTNTRSKGIRHASRFLKAHRKNGLRIIGMWSIEIG